MKTARKWALGLLVLLLVAGAASFLWVDYQLNRFAGAHTDVVDHTRFQVPPQLTAITNVHVLSPDGRRMIAGQTVLFDGEQIISIDDGRAIPEGARVVDGGGQYLIPGLVDSHVHLRRSPNDLLLYVANGVTHVREMSGSTEQLGWRSEIASGRMGPGMFMASEKLGDWGWFKGHFRRWTRNRINVNTGEEAGALIQSMSERGFDAVKLGGSIGPELYRDINRAADSAGLPVVGHIPAWVTLDDVWSSGQSEIAHLEEIARALDREFGHFGSADADEYLEFVRERSPGIADRLAENDIAVTSTLWLMEAIPRQQSELARVLDEIQLGYVNPGQIEGTRLSKGWLPGNNVYELGPQADADERAAARTYWTTYAEAQRVLLRAMVDRGVRVMAGTDAGNAVVVPGFSMHDELTSLVDAGMSPSGSLRSATAVPGEWMGIRTGSLQPGYRPDMVLLGDNPLESIENTRSIRAVVIGGRLVDRAGLDAMLRAVREANDRSRRVRSEFLD